MEEYFTDKQEQPKKLHLYSITEKLLDNKKASSVIAQVPETMSRRGSRYRLQQNNENVKSSN